MNEENRKKKGITAVVLLSILVALLGVLFVLKLVSVEKKAKSDGEKYVLVNDGSRYFLSDNGLYSSEYIVAGEADGSILYESSNPEDLIEKSSWARKGFLSFKADGAKEGDLLILEFTVKSENPEIVPMYIDYDEQREVISLQEGKRRCYIPFRGKEGERSVLLSFEITGSNAQAVEFSDIRVADYGKDIPASRVKTGIYTTEEFEQLYADYSPDEPTGYSVVANDKYLYAIKENYIAVYRTASLSEEGRVYGIGGADRLVKCENANRMLALSEEGSFCLIDISTPEAPTVLASYITVSGCTGADTFDKYAFFACGDYGVEVVDLSSDAPAYVTLLKPSEAGTVYSDCHVANGVLYAFEKGKKTVDIYDISDLNAPNLLTKIETTGAIGNLCTIGSVLYVASAGTDCGIEIYDIVNPEFPVLLSKELADGRVSLPGKTPAPALMIDGETAFLSFGEAGLYIYDITDPVKPVRQSVFNITTDVGQSKFKNRDLETILPYDYTVQTHADITQTVINDSGVFCLSSDMGIYQVPLKLHAQGAPDKGDAEISAKIEKEEPEIPEGYEAQFYKPEGCIYALAAIDDRQFAAACGGAGIKVLDKQMRTICSLNTRETVKDVKVVGDLIYSAESGGGLAIYRYESGILSEVGRVETAIFDATADYVEVSENGCFAIVQSGRDDYQLVDCTDPENPVIIKHPTLDIPGVIPKSGICKGVVANRYFAIAGDERILWIYENGYTAQEGGEIKAGYRKDLTGLTVGKEDGFAAIMKNFIILNEAGYHIYNPENGELIAEGGSLDGWLCGSCVSDGNMLYVSNAKEGRFAVVDFSDPANPNVVFKLDTDYITDVPCIVDGEIYVPLHHDGVMKLTKE